MAAHIYWCFGLLCMWSCVTHAQRLLVAGGSLTEIVYALGAESQLVAVDDTSQYPKHAQTLPNVGYYRSLSTEGVLSVAPDTVLLLAGAGPPTVVQQLRQLGVRLVPITEPKTLAGLRSSIQQVAAVVGKPAAGAQLITTVEHAIDAVLAKPQLNNKTAVFLMSAGQRGLVAAGSETTPQLLFRSLNISNPFADLSGYKPVSAESLAASAPDIVLIASHTTASASVAELCASPELALWARQQGCQLHRVDSLKYLGLTPRLAEAMDELYGLLSGTHE